MEERIEGDGDGGKERRESDRQTEAEKGKYILLLNILCVSIFQNGRNCDF